MKFRISLIFLLIHMLIGCNSEKSLPPPDKEIINQAENSLSETDKKRLNELLEAKTGTLVDTSDIRAIINPSLPPQFKGKSKEASDYYRLLLGSVNSRNPELDADINIKRNKKFMLIYTQDNSAIIKKEDAVIISQEESPKTINTTCQLKYIQGLESNNYDGSIYGVSQWIAASKLMDYGSRFNAIMAKECIN